MAKFNASRSYLEKYELVINMEIEVLLAISRHRKSVRRFLSRIFVVYRSNKSTTVLYNMLKKMLKNTVVIIRHL